MNNEELATSIKIIQYFYTKRFKNFYLTSYKAYCLDENFFQDEFDEFKSIEWSELNSELKYLKKFLDTYITCDGFYIGIYEVPIQDLKTITCRIKTDGDDGWLFIFGEDGQLITAGQTYIEVIIWIESSLLKRYSDHNDFLEDYWSGVPGFSEAHDQSLWGKTLEEIENRSDYNNENN